MRFTVWIFIRPRDLRVKVLCQGLSSDDDGSVAVSCVHVTRLLLERRNISTIELYGPCSVRLWAVLNFLNFEGMSLTLRSERYTKVLYESGLVLFFCCFQALKAQDIGEPVSLIAQDLLEGEERLFNCTIIDDGYEHILEIYRDTETGAVRLQASVSSGEMQNTPVWTAFITHVLHSPSWKEKVGRTVHLADIQHIVFTSRYNPSASLNFTTITDASQFLDTINSLML